MLRPCAAGSRRPASRRSPPRGNGAARSRLCGAAPYDQTDALLREGALLKGKISTLRKEQMDRIQERDVNVKASMVYLNVLQESQELVSYWRHLLRADRMFQTDLKK